MIVGAPSLVGDRLGGVGAQARQWVTVGAAVALGALRAVTTAVGYHDLRVSEEGIGIEGMVKVFA
jgi:hypothetical protein